MSTDMTGEAVAAEITTREALHEGFQHMHLVLGVFEMNLERAAMFRYQKAEEYPEDGRNLEAANLLDRLAKEFPKLPGKDFTVPFAFAQGVDGLRESEIIHEYLSRVGFDHFPADAGELVRDLTARLVGEDA
ncbi:hypothetical protein [Devosia sp. 63-57]|uniref:hypothetical protein n=1 Tax=Devosia sp. 63-57 TaxID=1895751 RepID=UPI00086CD986|nr:hypothetical protein [Devosia sp. 63-57]ODT47077.1 MAG: hypothetical protein ABS74_12235 [Pelagibacterium sp. SCN 63-126]ODU88894.1 MAG: hypothetical protein ABT14_01110 [Pelagibacterium sp. SCN 63-17]OJX43212.1 MAG: hypothetical protein BGO80_17635 [Devosia sp. 63-57]